MILPVFLATAINDLDRQALSVTAPIPRDQFGIFKAPCLRVISAFMLAYAVRSGLSGILIVRLGTRVRYALCMLWISVNALSPGTIDTAYHRNFSSRETLESVIKATPLRRLGVVCETASVVLFLCSRESRFIQGQVIEVNGGFSMA